MKQVLFILGLSALGMQAVAQPAIDRSHGPVKLDDVIANYKKLHPDYGMISYAKTLLPGLPAEQSEKHRMFEKWLWYWRQHTDQNSYLVSPAQDWQEWEKAKQQGSGAAAKTTSGAAAWTFVGPDSSEANGEGVGRINIVSFHPTDVNTYWVGTPGGGAWKTTNNGSTWTCMTDQLPVLAVSDVVFNPLNPNTIYLCSGDRDATDYTGVGILKSYNGGATWNTTGMSWTPSMADVANSMVINPLDTNTLIVGTTSGMYISHNGGASFTLVHLGNFMQVLYKPNDTATVYATSDLNFSAGTNGQVWRSLDGGTTWTQQTTLTSSYRVTLAVTPAAPNMVLAITASSDPTNFAGLDGVYKSSDAGATFTQIYLGGCSGNLLTWDAGGAGCNGQGWYTLPLAISPTDSNVVFTGGVNTWASIDGGVTWTLSNQESPSGVFAPIVHADKHYLAFHPLMPTRLFETNDGGIYSIDNPLTSTTWVNHTNRMGIEEIYRTSVSNIASFAITGAQDVGSKVVKPHGLFEEAFGDDGMTCRLDPKDSTVAYASGQQGIIGRLDPTSPFPIGTDVDIAGNIPGSVEGTGNWVTPFVILPTCHTCLLAGFSSVYRTNDKGNTWFSVSSMLTSNTLYRVVTTLADSNTIYATEDQGGNIVHYTFDGGATWSGLPSPYTGEITDIVVDPRDKTHFWITYGGYGSARVAEYTTSGGFHLFNAGLPNVPVSSIAFDYLSRDMYAGTEIGVYYRDSSMTSWQPFTNGMPSVRISDMSINYATNTIYAASYGRSLWKSPKHTTTVLINAVSTVPFAPDGVTVSPNPNHGSFTVTLKSTAASQVELQLLNAEGKSVWHGAGSVNDNKVNVNAGNLAPGTYILSIGSGNMVIGKQKVVIE